MADITLAGVTKHFSSGKESHTAVDGLNLTIADGEFVSLVGPSGCGKSTTLRMIAGLEAPDQGAIFVGERDVTAVPPQHRGLSMVFQNYAIFPHMTVRQNIGYGLRIARVPAAERDARVREVAALVRIEPLLDRYPRQLSGGQRQRVAVARALARNPDIVLLDEPLSNLDAKLRDQTRAELKQLHQRVRNTMVYVTHDQLEALTLSDRVAVMHQGRVQQYASPEDIFHRPANLFVASFVGTPTMNLLPADLAVSGGAVSARLDDGIAIALDPMDAGWVSPARPGPVVAGVRPEDVVVLPAGEADGLAATVTLVEPIGSEAIVHFRIDDARTVVAVVPESLRLALGAQVRLRFSADRMHLFDTASTDALFHGSHQRRAAYS